MVVIAPTLNIKRSIASRVFDATVFTDDLKWMISCILNKRENDLDEYLKGDRFLTSYQVDTCFTLLHGFLEEHSIDPESEHIYEVSSRGDKLIFRVVANKYVIKIRELEDEVRRLAKELDHYERLDID